MKAVDVPVGCIAKSRNSYLSLLCVNVNEERFAVCIYDNSFDCLPCLDLYDDYEIVGKLSMKIEEEVVKRNVVNIKVE